MDTCSLEESAFKQRSRASLLIQSEAEILWQEEMDEGLLELLLSFGDLIGGGIIAGDSAH
ncbi:hypothetical protein [Nitrobacter winogradskyi]|uniref:Uncharacterized protein n=2 Tax=Nitrobacter winogradskyi TaxID=913 RepID=A0ACC6ADT1_NITWI|nr:hypothetical protein [Nitrobacter winogradskyi]MCP1997888.1 hypothetical protein [Nitrobacter winogradskyi]GEC17180.1 hypothetical protein NWI01_30720 [Nitrobacter winogradskyi]